MGVLATTVVLWLGGVAAPASLGQPEPQNNPVYVDDAPAATESLAGVPSQLATGNIDAAVRVLQRLLDEEGERVALAPWGDPDLFVSVRSRAHDTLSKTPALLARYREVQGPVADRMLEEGADDAVERTRLLTRAGFEAALRVAQRELEAARFESALLTLRQLETHPDRTGEAGRDAAELLQVVARYVNRSDVWDRAERWARQAGAPTGLRGAETWPEATLRRGLSPLDHQAPVSLTGMLLSPLWSVPVGTGPVAPIGGRSIGDVPAFAQGLWILPTLSDETVYANDGNTISAWDRFTLSRLWSTTPQVELDQGLAARELEGRRTRFPLRPRGALGIEDAATVTVAGRDILTVTGVAGPGILPGAQESRRTSEGIHAIDSKTGQVRWSVAPIELDQVLTDTSVRGPLAVSEGTVIAGARRASQSQRLTSLYLLGLEQGTGRLRWKRLVGSAGSLPYGSPPSLRDGSEVVEGVVYRGDQLGVIGAYEAGTGRCVWVRRMGAPAYGTSEASSPWEINQPIIDGPTIVMLTPDRTEVVRLDRESGRILGRRPAADFSTPGPAYLLRVGDTLVGVGSLRLSMVPIGAFETDGIRQERLEEPGARGRVVVSGDRLLVPTATGVTLVSIPDQKSARVPPETLALASPGNVLPATSQLLVVDDSRLHAYLLWDEAERVLRQRMARDPADAGPAVTFAELAYRAGKAGQILGAVDAALSALDRGADGPHRKENEAARRRLWDSVLGMLNASQEPDPSAIVSADSGRLADSELVGELVTRLGRIASTADDRATHLLTLGRFREGRADAVGAVEAYQRILEEPMLAGATWTGPRVTLRAELEATWRLERLLRERGPAIYAPYDMAARSELAALGLSPDAAALERLARRFPLAAVAPGAWLAAGEALEAHGRPAATAYEAGLRAAQRRPMDSADRIGPLAGRLTRALESEGQWGAAAQVLRQTAAKFPMAVITDRSGPVDAESLAADLQRRWETAHRWANIGSISREAPQVLAGWSIMRPMIRDVSERVARVIAMENGEDFAVWTCGGSGGSEPCTGPLVKAWSAPMDGQMVSLMRVDQDAAYFFRQDATGVSLIKVLGGPGSEGGGSVAWKTETFGKMFARQEAMRSKDPGRPAPDAPEAPSEVQVIQTPLDGTVTADDLIYRTDERTIVLFDRVGRGVGLDAQTGQVLWAVRAPLSRVFDLDIRAGVLALAGEQDESRGGGRAAAPNGDPVGIIAVLDARTGRETQRFTPPGAGRIRWVLLSEIGSVIAGTDVGVVSVDAARGQANWAVFDGALRASLGAWMAGDRFFILGADRQLWSAAVRDGKVRTAAVAMPPEQLDESQPLYVAKVQGPPGQDALAFSTLRGIAVVGTDGGMLGIDALGGLDALVPALPGEGVLVTAETVASGHEPDGMMIFNVHLVDSASARVQESRALALGARPRRMALLDGRIAITAGSTTVVLRAD
ncbi:MAG: PQQ-binding-like beta-propeller repeat protein [Phycisphaeraceae bacterium]|nr:PQQ-binding-like beta-propeller repeat protein [Phycisphaeraceae bacterium]